MIIKPNQHTSILIPQIEELNHTSRKQHHYRPKPLKNMNSNFSYLGFKLANALTRTTKVGLSLGRLAAELNDRTKERSDLLPNPNVTENTNHERKEHGLRSDLREQGQSSSSKEGDLRANPSRAFRESKGKG